MLNNINSVEMDTLSSGIKVSHDNVTQQDSFIIYPVTRLLPMFLQLFLALHSVHLIFHLLNIH